MVLFGVDFGRVFLGWVTLTNAVREAANFAAINPDAWTAPGSPSAVAEFERLINAEAAEINCALPATLPDPSFPNGTSIGSPAVVSITCQFSLITPIIGNLLGNPLDVSASASFPIRSGAIAGVPTAGGPLPTMGQVVPTATPGTTQGPIPTATTAPTATPIPTPSGLATPVPMCTVPNLEQGSLKTDAAVGVWTAAGFNANALIFSPLVPPHYDIKDQSRVAGTSVVCSSSMTVYDKRQR